ncbi:MAG: M48 family metallopeptidase [Opitutaceae bacterium]|nr:M48 family metallopeptidase [Opitutaceae bacterium]
MVDRTILNPAESILHDRLESDDIEFRRHPRARRYLLRVTATGKVAVTLPRWGTQKEAMKFVEEQRGWIQAQRRKRIESGSGEPWRFGSRVILKGESFILLEGVRHNCPIVIFGDNELRIADREMDLRRPVEAYFRLIAKNEMPGRVKTLAEEHSIAFHRVSIRGQSTRWGSCSAKGTISLNWRLIQVPQEVRDYVILHELMHRKEMNHSSRFWALVEEACPRYREYDRWLDDHVSLIGL